eukprot:3116278-Prymnesium_polylepis.1
MLRVALSHSPRELRTPCWTRTRRRPASHGPPIAASLVPADGSSPRRSSCAHVVQSGHVRLPRTRRTSFCL